jgi:phage gpG-like protein
MSASRDGYATEIHVDENLSVALKALGAAAGDLSAAFDDAGMSLTVAAQRRFENEVDPAGVPWAPLSEVTLALRRRRGVAKEMAGSKAKTDKGKAAARARAENKVGALLAAAKILHQDGHLKGGVSHRFGADFVEVGTDRVYGRIQHLGGPTKGFIKGEIPTRPFLPNFGGADAQIVMDALSAHMARAMVA